MTRKKLLVKPQEQNFAINLVQHLVIPTFVIDTDCRVIVWNKACERLTGVSAVDVIGTSEHWRAFYESPNPCLADILVRDELDNLNEFYTHHHVLPSEWNAGLCIETWCSMPRLETQCYLAIDAGPIYDNEGNLLAVVETLRDMTEYKRAQIALQQLSTTDSLTGLVNRKTFDQNLFLEWQRAQRHRMPISLIMADVDNFKSYNDDYGHMQGDACLKIITGLLQQGLGRPTDLASRFGAEEFALILPNTDLPGAVIVARRICESVFGLKLPHVGNVQHNGVVTVSLGVASMIPRAGEHSENLITAADNALYRAKQNGRNCVEIFERREI